MLAYIFLVIGAIIVFPVLYYLMTKGKAGKSVVVMTAAGFIIALVGIYLQDHFGFYYAGLAMLGLAFAAGVVIDKRFADETVADGVEEVVRSPIRLGPDPEQAAELDETPVITPADVRAAMREENSGTISPLDSELDSELNPMEKNHAEPDVADVPGMEEIVLPGTADIVHPPQFGDDGPKKANPAAVAEAAGKAGRYDYNDGPDLIGKEKLKETPVEETESISLGDDDFINPAEVSVPPAPDNEDELPAEEELESWLSARPVMEEEPDGMSGAEPDDVRMDYNPFDLLDDEDFIAEEEEDGKQ
ncbi:MFS transporter [Edaphobacillus lindanitolerans]|uniref:Uncharacterized protein n=1 Tax=Edaphobacillus lindanitolerans TaxID=550447 RepID=A0A1U7PJZ4_9BACI|nr:MFS transporter [Edaphobacillus lindanitolerans]SIT83260.1 hypothetical protein SAMN05428946_1597 [Edaphobacillus lindanitolerans]